MCVYVYIHRTYIIHTYWVFLYYNVIISYKYVLFVPIYASCFSLLEKIDF